MVFEVLRGLGRDWIKVELEGVEKDTLIFEKKGPKNPKKREFWVLGEGNFK